MENKISPYVVSSYTSHFCWHTRGVQRNFQSSTFLLKGVVALALNQHATTHTKNKSKFKYTGLL